MHGKEHFLIDQDLANHINGAPLIVETTTKLSAVEVGLLISIPVLFSKLTYFIFNIFSYYHEMFKRDPTITL